MDEEFCETCECMKDGNFFFGDYEIIFTCESGHETLIPYVDDEYYDSDGTLYAWDDYDYE